MIDRGIHTNTITMGTFFYFAVAFVGLLLFGGFCHNLGREYEKRLTEEKDQLMKQIYEELSKKQDTSGK